MENQKKLNPQKVQKKLTQKDKQERGEKGEALITASLKKIDIWNYKFINAGYGTAADKLVVPPGGGYLLEIKTRQEPKIGYNLKSITLNERKGMDKFERQVGKGHSLIVGIWATEDFHRAFLIPWCQVREEVLSGGRGSIKMLDFPELKKIAGGWDLSCLGSVSREREELKS